MNMMDEYWVRLSVRGPTGKYIGSDDVWDKAEAALKDAASANNLPVTIGIDEAAFYGPKLDFMFKDAIGRPWQLSTIQCDFNLPERFKLEFTNEKNERERPVVIHRAIAGSLERFMGVMIEHFAGAFPTWLSPVQVHIVPISDTHLLFAQEVRDALLAHDVRVELTATDESLGKRIRAWKVSREPYALVIGDAEVAVREVAVESRDEGKLANHSVEQFVEKVVKEIKGQVAKTLAK